MASSTSAEPVVTAGSIEPSGQSQGQDIPQQHPSTLPRPDQISISARSSPRPPIPLALGIQRAASQPSPHQTNSETRSTPSLAVRRFEAQQRKNSSDTAAPPTLNPTLASLATNSAPPTPVAGSNVEQNPLNASDATPSRTNSAMHSYGNNMQQGQSSSLQDEQSLQQHEKQQQLMNFLTGYSVNQGVGMGNGVFPGMGMGGNFTFGMRPMTGSETGMVMNAGLGPSVGPQDRNEGNNARDFYPGSMHGGPFDGMNLVDQNGMPVQMSAPQWPETGPQALPVNQNSQYPGHAGPSAMRHPFLDGSRPLHASPATTPLASKRANLPQAQSGGSSGYPAVGSPANQYATSPVNASYNSSGHDQGMDYGSIAMRFNQQNRTAGSLPGMAPYPSGGHGPYQHGGPSQNPTPVAPNWGHIGLPEPSPANTPHLGATSHAQGTNAMDWTDASGRSRRDSDMNGAFVTPEVKVERPGRQMREKPNKSGTVTPVTLEQTGTFGGMSVPTSPEKLMNMPGGHQAGLISGVENALAGLNTGAGHDRGTTQAAARSRKKNTSASSSRVNSPDRKRKAAPVFSYSGALSALNSRAGSPTAEHDGAKLDPNQPSLSHVDMHAVGQALRADDSVNEAPSSEPVIATGPTGASTSAATTDVSGKGDYRKRKRNRTIQSCLPCHQNKRKCDRKKPCSRCKALGLTGSCVYEVDHDRDENDPEQSENDHLRDRIAELEQVVRELRQKGAMRTPVVSEVVDPALHKKRKFTGDVSQKVEAFVKEGKLSASSSRRTSVSDGQNHDPTRRASMRTWGSGSRRSSPEHGEEPYLAHTLLSPGEALIGDSLGRQAYVGVPGGRNMLRRLADLTATHANSRDLHDGHRGEPLESAAFTGFFPDQRKTFPFTTIWSHEHFSSEVVGILPSPVQARVLWMSFEEEIARYFSAWHLPSLKAEFEAFFELSNEDQMMTTLGTLSVMLMVCSLAVMVRASEKEIFGSLNDKSLSISDDEDDLTCSRMQSELYLSGAYQALRLCSFMSSPTISTITSEIMMVIYLLNSERASDAWPELGIVIRQAVAMGLHIDPLQLYPDLSFKDAEVRRRVWWTIAGLDALLCLSLGRPTAITYYTTQLPQDRPDEQINDQNDYPSYPHPASETTTFTYHAAYFALTIPSLDILGRVFHQDRRYGRSVAKGWFAPPATEDGSTGTTTSMGSFTYDDALRLDGDILAWYNLIPPGMRFDPDVDTADTLLRQRPQWQINQTLALCVKVQMIRLILHRPYLRVDPSAYTHSTDICFDASHAIMCAFKAMSGAKSSIAWSWWTMSLRAFHAGTVCAFLAIRQPDKSIAVQCLEDIRGAIMIFTGRLRTWLKAHPVQGHLCQGLVSLERLATTATRLSRERQDAAASANPNTSSGDMNDAGSTLSAESQMSGNGRPTSSGRYFNKSSIQAFPSLNSIPTSPAFAMESHAVPRAGSSLALNVTGRLPEEVDPTPFQHVFPVTQRSAVMENAAGARGSVDAMGLPQFWADVFGLPMDEDKTDANPLLAL